MLGNPEASVTIIEYASLSCPHCAEFHNKVLPGLKEKYIDTGKVAFVFRPFPLNLPAFHGTVLAYCAGDKRFYNFLKVLFDTQESWAFHKNYLEMLSNIGKLGGIKPQDFDRCIEDKALEESILETKKHAANTLKLRSTPTFYVNGVQYEKSFRLEPFSQYLDELLPAEVEDKLVDNGEGDVPELKVESDEDSHEEDVNDADTH